MKKFIAIILGTMFVLALAGSVYAADLRVGGDAYVEGVWTDNYGGMPGEIPNGATFDKNERSDSRYWAERVVLKLDAVLENGIELRTAYDVVGGFKYPAPWGEAYSSSNNLFATTYNDGFMTEYAYIHVPLGKFTVDAGHMLSSWGDGFDSFETPCDRLKVYYKVNDTVTVAGYVRKDYESFSVDNGKGDTDTYELEAVVTPDAATKAGLALYFTQDQQDKSFDDRGPVSRSRTTWKADVFANTKVGPVAVMSEFAYRSANKSYDPSNSAADSQGYVNGFGQFGGFVLVQGDVAPVTLTGAVAFATNGYAADDDFQPTLLFGTRNNPVALMDFQSLGRRSTTWAALAAADFKANDCTTLHGLLAYASLGDGLGDVAEHPDADKALGLVEADATVKYQISKSTAWTVGATIGIPTVVPHETVFDGHNNNVYGAFQRLSVSF